MAGWAGALVWTTGYTSDTLLIEQWRPKTISQGHKAPLIDFLRALRGGGGEGGNVFTTPHRRVIATCS